MVPLFAWFHLGVKGSLLISVHSLTHAPCVHLQGKIKRLWDIKTSVLTPAAPMEDLLPSDAQQRKDVTYLKAGDQVLSQEWKLILEEQQRKEGKLRSTGSNGPSHPPSMAHQPSVVKQPSVAKQSSTAKQPRAA